MQPAPRTPIAAAAVALAHVLLFGSMARADQLDERAQDVIDALRRGDVPRAVEVLTGPDVADALVDRPALVHVICDRAYRFDDAMRAAPESARRRLSGSLLDVAERAHAAAPEDVRGTWALAQALVVRERSGPVEGAAAWLRAADLLEQAHERRPGEGEALGYAATFLLEGAAAVSDQQYVLQKRAATVAKAAARAHPKSVTLATTLASAHLWGARTLLGSNRRAGKSALQVVFAQLSPHLRRELPNAAVAALWNDAVTLGAEAGFALRERYVTVPALALGGSVMFDVPVSPRWTVTEVPASGDYGAYVYVTQTDAAGNRLRQLLFRRYTWGYSYSFVGPVQVKGDNVKNLARGLRDVSCERVFAPGAEASRVRKSKMGKGFVGQQFVITGTVPGDAREPLTLYGYCVRGSHQETYGFLVYAYADGGAIDVEMEFVLAGLREPED